MCFSASASFTAGIGLSVLGVATLRKAGSKAQLPFAAIPLLFGIRQIIEGMLWLSFRFHAPLLNTLATYGFLLFSHVLWPVFVPFSIRSLETVARRRRLMSGFLVAGATISLGLLYLMIRYPVRSMVDTHIVYVLTYFFPLPAMALYLVATCVSTAFSSDRLVKLFGAMVLLLFFVTYRMYTDALFSTWCFSAALLSVTIYLYFSLLARGGRREPSVRADVAMARNRK